MVRRVEEVNNKKIENKNLKDLLIYLNDCYSW
jgi:hypothetical protein